MNRPTFAELTEKIQQHRSELDELKSLAYGIQTVNIENKVYSFVCFYDQSLQTMSTTLLDQHNNELRLTTEIPLHVMVAYGAFCWSVMEWQNGKAEFPVDPEQAYNAFVQQHHQVAQVVRDEFKLDT